MAKSELSLRVAALEAEMARVKEQLRETPGPKKKGLVEVWYGAFANDPYFDEIVRLGREYRESLRPKPARAKRPRRKTGGAAESKSARTKRT